MTKGGEPESNIQPAKLSKPAVTRVIKELGANDDHIVILPHCFKRMKQRKINDTQIRRVVQAGFIDGDPYLDQFANWRVTMRGLSAGTQITIVVAIDWKTRLLVVTVY